MIRLKMTMINRPPVRFGNFSSVDDAIDTAFRLKSNISDINLIVEHELRSSEAVLFGLPDKTVVEYHA